MIFWEIFQKNSRFTLASYQARQKCDKMFYFKSPFNRHCLITNAARTGKLRTRRGVYVAVVEIAVRHQILLTYGLRATLDKAFGELEINIPPVEFEKVKMNFLSKALSLFCFLH